MSFFFLFVFHFQGYQMLLLYNKQTEKLKTFFFVGFLREWINVDVACLSVMQWKKEMASQDGGPPGYDPTPDNTKPKTKAVKRNERKKEKRLQVCHLRIGVLFLYFIEQLLVSGWREAMAKSPHGNFYVK